MNKHMIVVVLFVIGMFTTNLSAQQCDLVVVDEAGEFGERIIEVEKVANELRDLGAEVRVRTIKNVGDAGSIDKYFEDQRRQCVSWQSPDGQNYKSNFVLFAHARQDRAVLIKSGYQWKDPVNQNYLRIQQTHMKPRFMENDFTGAFTAGMGETRVLLYNYLHPTTPQSTSTTVINAGNLGFYGFIGFVVLIVVFGFYFLYQHSRKKKTIIDEAMAVGSEALISKERATNRLLEFEQSRQFLLDAGSAEAMSAVEAYDRAWRLYRQYVRSDFFVQADDTKLSKQQYQSLLKAFDEVNELIDSAEARAQKFLPEEDKELQLLSS